MQELSSVGKFHGVLTKTIAIALPLKGAMISVTRFLDLIKGLTPEWSGSWAKPAALQTPADWLPRTTAECYFHIGPRLWGVSGCKKNGTTLMRMRHTLAATVILALAACAGTAPACGQTTDVRFVLD